MGTFLRVRTMSWICVLACLLINNNMSVSQPDTVRATSGSPVVLGEDTLLFIGANLGPFAPHQRAEAVRQKLDVIIKQGTGDSIVVTESGGMSHLMLDSVVIMAITDDDAALQDTSRAWLAAEYAQRITQVIRVEQERYSVKSLLISAGITVGLLIAALLVFWIMRKIFPRVYDRLEALEGKVFPSIRIKGHELLSAETISSFFILLAKGVRLAITLWIIYIFVTYSLSLFPWTKGWEVEPILAGLLLSILLTAAAISLQKAIGAIKKMLEQALPGWRGTLIKPVRLKAVEVLSEDRILEFVEWGVKVVYFALMIVLGYFYVTLLFSFFAFTKTWAATLFGYILEPLGTALAAIINFLPNLFYILVIGFLTRYVLIFLRFIFTEIGKGTITLPGFYQEWAMPTYKIVRFLVIAFAAIVIFPYLPGSDSPFFQGISVFLGILFSLGSTSAIANIVAGVVLTYMRPFRIGDRVRIADTMGDVVEKTLLVTRVRTVKNVDITIPNAMVLGSHIVNFSSSAVDKGLILHTTVTIGYDAPWKQVHDLLISAAKATEDILKEPAPFVLQTSLNDFYPSYELNAYTNNPARMARIYSELHQNIQDKFNEGGVEIMSPHYSAVRDGNQVTIPQDYLPKSYQAPPFRIFPLGNLLPKKGRASKSSSKDDTPGKKE